MSLRILLMLCLAAAPALAGARTFVPVPQEGQRIEYENGTPLLFIERETFSAVVVFEPEDRKHGWVSLGVRNHGPHPFLLSEESMTASDGSKALRVFTYEDLMKRQRRRETWAQIGAGLAAGMNSYGAGQQGYGSYSGSYSGRSNATVYGKSGTAYVSGTSSGYVSGTYYDPAAAAQARAVADRQNRELIQQVAAKSADQRARLDDRALRANTLDPDEAMTGAIMIVLPRKTRDGSRFIARLRIGEATEVIEFRESSR